MSFCVFESMSVKPLEDILEGRKLQCISHQIVWGFSDFMCLGIFPSPTSKPNNHGRRLHIFHNLFLKFVPYKELMGEENLYTQSITDGYLWG